ncbi:CHAT domain-containing protein [Kitasatospora sp. NPDC059160]|uniref:CHAT domain-containing tetratricopeptide repeat protein n=1 Tax=Kitasatospora sp. NPDC059160 TaxID=3346748 RepID=UPI0036AA1118
MPDIDLGITLANLGKLLALDGDPRAEAVLTEAVELLTAAGPEAAAHLAEARGNLAAYHQLHGDPAVARSIYRELRDAAAGMAPSAAVLRNFAALEQEEGRSPSRRMLLELAHDARPQAGGEPDDPDATFRTLIEQASEEDRLGNLARALELALRAADVARARPRRSPLRTAVALVATARYGLDVPDEHLDAALTAAADDPETTPELLRSLRTSIGQRCRHQGRLTRALAYARAAAAHLAPATATEEQLNTFDLLALVHHALDERDQAEQLYRAVITRRRELADPNRVAMTDSLFSLGMLCLETGRLGEAAALVREQLDIEDAHLLEVFAASSEVQRLAYARTLLGRLDAFVVVLLAATGFEPGAELLELLANAVLRRKAVVAEAVARDRAMLSNGPEPGIAAVATELRTVRHELRRLALDDEPLRPHPDRHVHDLRARQGRLEMLLADRLSHPGPGTGPNPDTDTDLGGTPAALPTWQAVTAALPPGTALVEYYRAELGDEAAVLSLVFTPGSPPQLFTHGTADTLDQGVRQWREFLRHQDTGERALGLELHRVLIRRIDAALTGVDRLLISPDGSLNLLPFAALPSPDGSRLLDTFEIGFLTTGRDLLRGRYGPRPAPPVVFADIDYEAGGTALDGGPFAPLPETGAEGRWIADHISAELYTGPDASTSRLRTARSPLVLHLATHGYALAEPLRPTGARRPDPGPAPSPPGAPPPDPARTPDPAQTPGPAVDPLLCTGLALAGANTFLAGQEPAEGLGPGVLTASDVYDLDLLGTELVVLSACVTGLGSYHPGEGVFGLRRTFEIAGARSVLVSVWDVPSEPTVQLMCEFYRALRRGASRTAALRRGQQAVRRRFPEPVAWAPFALFGDPGPLPW